MYRSVKGVDNIEYIINRKFDMDVKVRERANSRAAVARLGDGGFMFTTAM